MAEFTRVMRAAKRMCVSHEYCSECPMTATATGCALMTVMEFDKPEAIEQIVMKWAAENTKEA